MRVGRPLRRLALAWTDGVIVGAASAVADTDEIWQVGIDVDSSVRGRGIAAALSAHVTRAVLDAGRAPLWGAAPTNLPSLRTALSVGYTLSWVEAFTAPSDLTV